MSPHAVDARIAAASAISPLDFAPLVRVDMSPAGVESRLQECSELTTLCLELVRDGQRTA